MYLTPGRLFFCISCVLLFGQTDAARAIEYEFTKVVTMLNPDGTSKHKEFLYNSGMNDSGEVVFAGLGGTAGTNLFRATSPDSYSIAAPGRYDYFDIGNSGAILYVEDCASDYVLYKSTDQGIAKLADTTGPFHYFGNPYIDEHENVYFKSSHDEFSERTQGIYSGLDPLRDVVVDSSGPFREFGGFQMNRSGDIVFSAELYSGEIGLFTGSDALTDKIASVWNPSRRHRSEYALYSTQFDINDHGTIVYSVRDESGVEGIYVGPNPETDTVVDTNGPYSSLSRVYLSNDDRITFRGRYEASDGTRYYGIFSMKIGAEPDPENDAVIRWKDDLFGSTISSFSIRDVNRLGQVLFEFNGDDFGLAIASPIIEPGFSAVPEPGSLTLVILGALLGVCGFRTRSR